MLVLDHIAVVAPSLEAGVAHVRESLGLAMGPGGRHPEMGTHNRLLRLGDDLFLEVIAVDPEAAPPPHRRWFGLDESEAVRADWAAGRRLRSFVARTDGLDALLARHAPELGEAQRVSRGDRVWRFGVRPDGAMPRDGLLPSLIDWGPAGCPAPAMPEAGARLRRLLVTHPEPGEAAALYARLGLSGPFGFEAGPGFALSAEIETPSGLRRLT
ncbi:MAG TPA: VOC family protein [Methylobacterium sp.]|nr:VOC family protein [Methylobacterium sp.]